MTTQEPRTSSPLRTMRAFVYDRELQLATVDRPQPEEGEALVSLREYHPKEARAIFKMLAGQEALVARRFRQSKDTESMLRDQGALIIIDSIKDKLNKFMEVIN